MTKAFFKFAVAALLLSTVQVYSESWLNDNGSITQGQILNDIPEININEYDDNWNCIPDVAQYKKADWSQVIGRAKNVTVSQAKEIAESNSAITYFFFVKGGQMVLENTDAEQPFARIFQHGEAVFFSGTPWWGTAPGLADGYTKKIQD